MSPVATNLIYLINDGAVYPLITLQRTFLEILFLCRFGKAKQDRI